MPSAILGLIEVAILTGTSYFFAVLLNGCARYRPVAGDTKRNCQYFRLLLFTNQTEPDPAAPNGNAKKD